MVRRTKGGPVSNLTPSNLLLRCYGHRVGTGKYYGVCLELNLAAEADSVDQLKKELGSMITSYIETVMDTDDQGSIPMLFDRPAPLGDHLKYHLIKILLYIKRRRKTSFSYSPFLFQIAPDRA